jgi:hypothetical protein
MYRWGVLDMYPACNNLGLCKEEAVCNNLGWCTLNHRKAKQRRVMDLDSEDGYGAE